MKEKIAPPVGLKAGKEVRMDFLEKLALASFILYLATAFGIDNSTYGGICFLLAIGNGAIFVLHERTE